MAESGTLRRRIGDLVWSIFDVDADWTRPDPGPAGMRADAGIALAFFVFGAIGLELTRSMGLLHEAQSPILAQYLVLALGTAPLIWRRRYPISVMLLLQAHLFAAGIWLDAVAYQFTMQVVYFFALYSGVAWARDRRAAVYAVGGVLVLMFGWFVWSYALGNAYDSIMAQDYPDGQGLIGRFAASVSYAFLINAAYFGGALLWGRSSWRSAHQMAELQDQAGTIAAQAAGLRDQAVVQERLRIARELHDVVAHHVSVMGVQAAAARRVLTRDPAAAAEALASVEESSRSAVGEKRALLGTLREPATASDPAGEGPVHRAPDPGLGDLAALVAAAAGVGFLPTYELVEDVPDAAARVPAPLALSTYRIVQEALSNVRKHSSATRVSVVVRVETQRDRYVEAEVVDDGRPLGATSGTGLGMLGMRERIASHGGQLDVGPRLTGGYRVRVRFPLDRTVAAPDGRPAVVASTSRAADAAMQTSGTAPSGSRG
ncbi:MAG: histidine kinase [Actinobacteria bacterium]|nr:histidine kinase [Actinomycetota bacterium]